MVYLSNKSKLIYKNKQIKQIKQNKQIKSIKQIKKKKSRKISNKTKNLVKKMNLHMTNILIELQNNKKKISHWSWWVFPTNKSGLSEPSPKTSVKYDEIDYLINNAPKEWIKVLQLICKIIKKNGGYHNVIPEIDYGRIRFFIKFLSNHHNINSNKYKAIKKCIKCLSKYSLH